MMNRASRYRLASIIIDRSLKGKHTPGLREMLIQRLANVIPYIKEYDMSDVPDMLKAYWESRKPKK